MPRHPKDATEFESKVYEKGSGYHYTSVPKPLMDELRGKVRIEGRFTLTVEDDDVRITFKKD